MPSNQAVRDAERVIGLGIGSLLAIGLASGLVLGDWAVIETWVPLAVLATISYPFYRLVIAIEHIAYDPEGRPLRTKGATAPSDVSSTTSGAVSVDCTPPRKVFVPFGA